MDAILKRLEAMHSSGVLGQLVRFGISGGISTLIYGAVYLPLAIHVLPEGLAFLAVPPAFLVAAAIGFVLHGRWSFRGYGTRDRRGRQQIKFLGVQGFGMVLNALFTWIIVDLFGGPAWAPLLPTLFVVPLVTFTLNRKWVFG